MQVNGHRIQILQMPEWRRAKTGTKHIRLTWQLVLTT